VIQNVVPVFNLMKNHVLSDKQLKMTNL